MATEQFDRVADAVDALLTELLAKTEPGDIQKVEVVSGTITVTGPLTDMELRATPVPVSGAVTASGPLTDTQLRATPVPVSGTVTASGPLTDTQLRATPVPVSGPLTDTELRATPVPVSGTVTASGPLTDTELRATPVPVSGTVTASGPLTDTQLRATPVPVSGTVTASGPLTDIQLRASPVPVSGTVTANLAPVTTGGLLISRLLSAATTNSTNAKASAGQVYGWYLFNANASTRYVKLFNKASAPDVGVDTPALTIPLPGGAAANVEFAQGITFTLGIGYGTTTGAADNDTGAVALNEIIVNLLYK